MARKPKWGARPSLSLGLGCPALPLSPERPVLARRAFQRSGGGVVHRRMSVISAPARERSRDAPVLPLPVTPSDGRPRLGFWQQHLVLPVLELSIDRRPGAHTPASGWLPGRRARGCGERCSLRPGRLARRRGKGRHC